MVACVSACNMLNAVAHKLPFCESYSPEPKQEASPIWLLLSYQGFETKCLIINNYELVFPLSFLPLFPSPSS